MNLKETEVKLEKEFHVSWYIICYKMFVGIVELLFGLGIAFFGHRVLELYTSFAAQELSEDPHDLLIRASMNVVPNLLTHRESLVIYLMLFGIVKIIGSVGLIYKQNWGVDLLVVLTIVLFPFQVFTLIIHPNIFDLIYLVLGIFITLYLIEFKPKAWISRILLHFENLKDLKIK